MPLEFGGLFRFRVKFFACISANSQIISLVLLLGDHEHPPHFVSPLNHVLRDLFPMPHRSWEMCPWHAVLTDDKKQNYRLRLTTQKQHRLELSLHEPVHGKINCREGSTCKASELSDPPGAPRGVLIKVRLWKTMKSLSGQVLLQTVQGYLASTSEWGLSGQLQTGAEATGVPSHVETWCLTAEVTLR